MDRRIEAFETWAPYGVKMDPMGQTGFVFHPGRKNQSCNSMILSSDGPIKPKETR
jgi:hypothetical protein